MTDKDLIRATLMEYLIAENNLSDSGEGGFGGDEAAYKK